MTKQNSEIYEIKCKDCGKTVKATTPTTNVCTECFMKSVNETFHGSCFYSMRISVEKYLDRKDKEIGNKKEKGNE